MEEVEGNGGVLIALEVFVDTDDVAVVVVG